MQLESFEQLRKQFLFLVIVTFFRALLLSIYLKYIIYLRYNYFNKTKSTSCSLCS